jgi:hypothetical protein
MNYDESQIRTQNAVKDKTSNSFKTMGQTIGKYQQISCLQITERGWNIPSYYNRDSKAQQKDHQIYSKKMQKHHHWIGVFNLLKTQQCNMEIKINHPSISTNRATSWYHHYLTLATHVSKRQ